MNLNDLELEICWHKFLYYVKSDPIISDYQYDMMEKELAKQYPESEVLTSSKYIECPKEMWAEFEERYNLVNES